MVKILAFAVLTSWSMNSFAIPIVEREEMANKQCPLAELVRREDLMNAEFDIIGDYGRLFAFGKKGEPGCAYKGDYDGDCTGGPSGSDGCFYLSGPTCIENGSVWQRVRSESLSPMFYLTLERVDVEFRERLQISAYRSWGGTRLAVSQAKMAPMICP
jgi:hypothetical protein